MNIYISVTRPSTVYTACNGSAHAAARSGEGGPIHIYKKGHQLDYNIITRAKKTNGKNQQIDLAPFEAACIRHTHPFPGRHSWPTSLVFSTDISQLPMLSISPSRLLQVSSALKTHLDLRPCSAHADASLSGQL